MSSIWFYPNVEELSKNDAYFKLVYLSDEAHRCGLDRGSVDSRDVKARIDGGWGLVLVAVV